MKSTKKSLLISILSITLCVAMLLGTTYAWFTDSVQSGVNTIQAGNLDIELLHTNKAVTTAESVEGKTNLFQIDLWEPGVVVYENFELKNVGNLALKYNMALNASNYNTIEGKSLLDVLKVAVIRNGEFSGDREAAKALTGYTDMASALASLNTEKAPLAAGATTKFAVVVYWEESANDNIYNVNNNKNTSDGQPLFIDLGVALTATQLESESDSFGTDYDAAAIPAEIPQMIASSVSGKLPATTTAPTTIKSGDISVEIPKIESTNSPLSGKEIELEVETADMATGEVTYEISLSEIQGETKTAINNAGAVLTIKVNIGKGLSNVKVIHKDTPMTEAATGADQTFQYDKATGVLTICSSKFSPFSVEYETYWADFAAEEYATPVDASNKLITITSAPELALFAKQINSGVKYNGYTVNIDGELDMSKYLWIPINAFNGQLSDTVIDGNGHTIKNMKVTTPVKAGSNGGYDQYAGFIGQIAGKLTVKNLTFDGSTVNLTYSTGAAIVCGLTYSNSTFENITVKNSTVNGCTKCGAIVGFTGGDGVTVTINKCSVQKTTVNGDYSYAIVVGLVNYNDHLTISGTTVTDSNAVFTSRGEYDAYVTDGETGYSYGKQSDTQYGFVSGVNNAWAEKRNAGDHKGNETFLHDNGTL